YPTGDFQFRIFGHDPTGGYSWIDGIQLEEGPLTAYAPKSEFELGLNCAAPSNLFTNGQTASYNVQVRNNGGSATNVTVIRTTYDYLNRLIATNNSAITLQPSETQTLAFVLPTGYTGIHRVFSWVDGQDGTLDEILFDKQPAIQASPGPFTSLFGTHTDFTDYQFTAAKKLGINWTRTVSSGSYFRWTLAEPTDNNFVYFDTEVAKAAANNIDIFGALGVFFPAWAANPTN